MQTKTGMVSGQPGLHPGTSVSMAVPRENQSIPPRKQQSGGAPRLAVAPGALCHHLTSFHPPSVPASKHPLLPPCLSSRYAGSVMGQCNIQPQVLGSRSTYSSVNQMNLLVHPSVGERNIRVGQLKVRR